MAEEQLIEETVSEQQATTGGEEKPGDETAPATGGEGQENEEDLPEWKKVIPIEQLGKAEFDDPGTPLLQAARNHDLDEVKRLVKEGADINAQHQYGDLKGMTALHWFGGDGIMEGAEWLLSNGADIHLRDAWEQTVLHHCVGGGHLDMAKLLVKHGLDVNDKDGAFGQNALHWASNKGHGHVVEWLIDEMGMNPNEHDSDGQLTALHIASHVGATKVVNALLARGANPDEVDAHGKVPIMAAAAQDQVDVFNALLEAGANLAVKDKHNNTLEAYVSKEKVKAAYEAYKKRLKSEKSQFRHLYKEGIAEWDVEEVQTWLQLTKLEDIAEHFSKQQVDGKKILAEGGALIGDEKLRAAFNKRLQEANRHHTKYIEKKQHEHQTDMALTVVSTFILAFLIWRFLRRLVA